MDSSRPDLPSINVKSVVHFADVAGLKLHQKRVHQMPTLPPAKGDFREHSVDGMPVCRFCRKDLKTWHNFCRHFSGRHCLVMWRAQLCKTCQRARSVIRHRGRLLAREPILCEPYSCAVAVHQVSDRTSAQEPNTPLSQIRALCKPLSQWMSIAQHTDILEQLRHRCCICSQWVANIRSIKLHVLKVRPDFYNTAGAAALAACRKIGRLISPCRYCGAQVSKASQHASTCPVLWQLRLGAILTNPATQYRGGDGHGPG